MAEISVFIPCYNAQRTLEETLNSLAEQTFQDFEVVIVDDGSTDSTPQILQTWSERDPRIRVITTHHRGVVAASNTAVDHCRTTYAARMDADDLAHPERLEKQLALLKKEPQLAVVGSLVAGFPEDQVGKGFQLYYQWLNSLIKHEDITREIFIESPLANPSTTVRKSWISRVGGYQEHGWPEDYDLWLRMYLAGARFAKVPEILLQWREHEDRLTHTDSRYSVKNFLRAKAHYLAKGPALNRDAVIVWGAGMTGRRLSKHLLAENLPVAAFVDIDPQKIGSTRRGKPIISPDELLEWWNKYQNPLLLSAVRARKARPLIRDQLENFGLVESQDWWGAA